MSNFDVSFCSISDLSSALNNGDTNSVEVTELVIDRIKELDPTLNAFVGLTEERAFAEARASDGRRMKGEVLGPLDGIPYAAKDIFDVKDYPTMAGLRILEDNVANYDCTAVQRLQKAGMVLVGKTHTVQLAFHITGTNGDLGTPQNPWHEDHHIPGGSSSGSAVAVSAGLVPMALGSDTAGSIRVPAGLCGVTGFKPTSGRLGRGGVRPLSWTLDTIGPLTLACYDAALVAEALQGRDSEDETTLMTPSINTLSTVTQRLVGVEIIICDTVFFDDCDPEVTDAVRNVGNTLKSLGAVVKHAEIPEVREANDQPHFNTIISTEAFAVNGALYDQNKSAIDAEGSWMEEGKLFSGTDYYHAIRAQADLQKRFNQRINGATALLVPTAANPAWPLKDIQSGNGPKISYSRNTCIGNLLNLSGVSIPCGVSKKGLPLSAMIYTRPYNDALALNICHAIQTETDWHKARPAMNWIRN